MVDNSNLYAVFEPVFLRVREKPAFVSPGQAPISYGALYQLVSRSANALEVMGVGPGDRVMTQMEKSPGNVALYLATIKIGAIYCPLNTGYTDAELDRFVADCEPSALIRTGRTEDAFNALVGAQSSVHETCRVAIDDIAAIVYTSGTTGRSKGAMLTHGNLISNASTLHELWGFCPGDVLLHALPIYHVHGLFIALHTAFLNGSEIIWLDKFDIDAVLACLSRSSVMMGVPTYYTRLLGLSAFNQSVCANMRLFISGSAPLLEETHIEFEARTGHRILERYGMSETGMITSNPYAPVTSRIAGSVGFALPDVEVRVARDDGHILAADDVGVLEVRGPNVFSGYWRMEEETCSEFRNDGFFITGDLATMDSSGRVTLVGRAKDLIISGGLNVYPKEIELELDGLDGVLESAVIGIPHADFGEAVVGIVVSDGSDVLLDEGTLVAALESRLARFKIPKRIIEIDALPRNAMGKVQKVSLRHEFSGIFSNTI